MRLKNILPCFLLLIVALVSGCSSDNDVILELSPLVDLKTTSGTNQVVLSWTNPGSENLSHVEIAVLGISSDYQETLRHEVSSSRSEVIVTLPEGNHVYKFILTAFSTSGKSFAPAEIKGKPYTNDTQAGIDALLNSIRMESVSNGIKFTWSNSNNISSVIEVSYTESGSQKTVQFDAKSAVPSAVIRLNNQGSDFTVSVKGVDDAQGVNSTNSRTEYLQPNKPYRLSKELWSVYAVSSEATTEGDGSAACAIDDDVFTRWLATNRGGNDWIIVDLGKPVVVDRLSLTRYYGVGDNSAWDVTFAVGNDPDLETWEYEYAYANSKEGIFRVEFNRTIDGEQLYPLPEPVTGRYFKYRTDRISGSWWTHYGEISVYGYYVD